MISQPVLIAAWLVSALALSTGWGATSLDGWLKMKAIEPQRYVCARAKSPIVIDGQLSDESWANAPWTKPFQDIQGPDKPKPTYATRARMLWDDTYFYIAAELKEPHLWGTITNHDEVIFRDNDFEVFIDPDGDRHNYFEFEMNVLNAGWDLLLKRPYQDGGPALNSWEMPGLKTAVHVMGTINNPHDVDEGWSLEIAIPWKALTELAGCPAPPSAGDQWRVNFSRVEWLREVVDGRYQKVAGRPEDNWVWSPQGIVDMHRPEKWAYVQFAPTAEAKWVPDPAMEARTILQELYYRQRDYRAKSSRWATNVAELQWEVASPFPPEIKAETGSYRATLRYRAGEEIKFAFIGNDGRIGIEPPRQTGALEPSPEAPPMAAAGLDHGRLLYAQHCFICHQLNGQGVAGSYPPLAKSDFLAADVARSIRVLCEGLSGPINVNGKRYDGLMPPVALNDSDVADVLNYVLTSWGNSGGPIASNQVGVVRAKTRFPTVQSLMEASEFAPLPQPPAGFVLREVARPLRHPVRLTSDGAGKVLYALLEGGDIWRLEPETGALRQILWAKNYLLHRPEDYGPPVFVLGLTMDKQKRLYVVVNQQNKATLPIRNLVTIYRTTSRREDDPVDLKPWFETSYPGNSGFLHGAEELTFGPDGFLYMGNGARTDGNEAGGDPNFFKGGETELTSSIWRFDPSAEKPQLEVYARGIRNAYGFAWNDRGEMFATENGPDAPAPEELNVIERGKHYGFPYQFADWTKKAYAHTPDPPAGLEFTLPVVNLGPAGGYDGKPMSTFDPHSSPSGIVWLGNDFPEPHRGTFLVARFGNFLREPKDNVGYDLLQVRVKDGPGRREATVTTFLAPLARPLGLHHSGAGKIYICEYSRGTRNGVSFALPGRILELSVRK